MNSPLLGIHHVTAIASDPQANIDFYAGLLGLRLVKKTVNFDDPSAYHLYYGDDTGQPGTVLTFFYWPQGGGRGRVGTGQMTRLSFTIPHDARDFWRGRLERHGVPTAGENRSIGAGVPEERLTFRDPDGITVELVLAAGDGRPGRDAAGVPAAVAIRGFHTAELTVRAAGPTEALLQGEMGYRRVAREANRSRFEVAAGGPGTYIDVIADPETRPGLGGVGTIHHVAWNVADDAGEALMHRRLTEAGRNVSPVMDRSYFRSIYYREPGGVLFEIATAVPGFAVDEPVERLGHDLKLPAQYEHARPEITRLLPPLAAARTYA
jgi:glyoxalase family protein